MTYTLHLGVFDFPYVESSYSHTIKGKPKKNWKPPKDSPNSKYVTTGNVAKWLESRYGILATFYALNADSIQLSILEGYKEQFESHALGAPSDINMFGGPMSYIEDQMKKFISNRTMETLGIPGVPTQAALDGVNSRYKIRHGGRRPSFRDTGLYQSALHAWMEKT